MAEADVGILPVGENDRLVGMISDRDIIVRAVAAGQGPETAIGKIMSKEVMYCFLDDDVGGAAENMAELKVRRLPVLDHDKRLVGILSLGDVALNDGGCAGEALTGISEPGGLHSQLTDGKAAARGT
jgi:CBS domain-containing protein